jgi:hypothetical protein
MNVREQLDRVLNELSEKRLGEMLDFASFLSWRDAQLKQESDEWQQLALAQVAKAYGEDEPEYTAADLKPRPPHESR